MVKIRAEYPDSAFQEPLKQRSDGLDRKRLSDNLLNLYGNLEQGSVAILHGRWGVGKTTFAKHWLGELEREGFGTIYFDAFSNVYVEEPFDAIAAAILRRSAEINGGGSKVYEEIKKSSGEVSKRLATAALKSGVRLATLGLVDAEDAKAVYDTLKSGADDLSQIIAESAENLLERRAKDQAQFEIFRKSLSTLHDAISTNSDGGARGADKTIFVVDELDRCRPDFALGLIERLKHFFRVKGLHFVLITNRQYLTTAIANRYGMSGLEDEYLEKFYDFQIQFEIQPEHRRSHQAAVHAKDVISRLLAGNLSAQIVHDLEREVAELATTFDLTLRNVDHICTNVALASLSLERTRAFPWVIVYLAFFKSQFPIVYQRIKNGTATFTDVREIIESGDWENPDTSEKMCEIFQYHLDPDIDQNEDRWRSFGGIRHGSRLHWLRGLANGVVDTYG